MATDFCDHVMEVLFSREALRSGGVWAVLDAARDERIFPFLRDSGLDYLCLYSGMLPRELQRAAPYMVELPFENSLTRRLIRQAWGNSWGIFLSVRDSSNLRPHLRRFLRVRNEAGKYLLFRYYDPRVLRVYLPTCLPEELKFVFGPIESFLVEGQGGDSLLEFRLDGAKLGERRIVLDEGREQ